MPPADLLPATGSSIFARCLVPAISLDMRAYTVKLQLTPVSYASSVFSVFRMGMPLDATLLGRSLLFCQELLTYLLGFPTPALPLTQPCIAVPPEELHHNHHPSIKVQEYQIFNGILSRWISLMPAA